MTCYTFLLDETIKQGDEPILPKPFVTGKTLIKLGFQPGPKMGKLIKKIYSLQLDGTIANYQEAISFIEVN